MNMCLFAILLSSCTKVDLRPIHKGRTLIQTDGLKRLLANSKTKKEAQRLANQYKEIYTPLTTLDKYVKKEHNK